MAADPQDYAGERRRVAAGPTRPGCFWEFPAFLPSAGTVGAWDRRGPLLGPANRAGRAGPARMVRRFRCRTQRQVVLGQDQRGRPLNAVPLRSRRAGLGARRTAFTPLGWAPARPPEKQGGGCESGGGSGGVSIPLTESSAAMMMMMIGPARGGCPCHECGGGGGDCESPTRIPTWRPTRRPIRRLIRRLIRRATRTRQATLKCRAASPAG